MTKTFTREYLMEKLDLPWAAIEDEIVDQSRWSTIHSIVFKDTDGKYYSTEYSVGSTECQDERPWEYNSKIECEEVVKKQVLVEKWVPVESDQTSI